MSPPTSTRIQLEAEHTHKKTKRPSDHKEESRQAVLDGRTVDRLFPGEVLCLLPAASCRPAPCAHHNLYFSVNTQAVVLNFLLALFFFMCNIPFHVLDNFFFKKFMKVKLMEIQWIK